MLQDDFNDRKNEIESYIQLLEHVDATMQKGAIVLSIRRESRDVQNTEARKEEYVITPTQQKIMFSCLYLQLYNLIESTVLACISLLEKEIRGISVQNWLKLNNDLRQELIRSWAKQKNTNTVDANHSHAIQELVDNMLRSNNTLPFFIDKRRNGGNWSDKEIEDFAQSIGMKLNINSEVFTSVKTHIVNKKEKNAMYNNFAGLGLIKHFRNELTHGEVSFVQCGERLSLTELKNITNIVFNYLQDVISCFINFIDNKKYYVEQ